MRSAGAEVLTSWKEIARHLDVTVRTAQLWEKQRGLPVRRIPGPRGRVYLRIDEYEAWLAGAGVRGDGSESGAVATESSSSPEHVTTSPPGFVRAWGFIVVVGVVSLLVGMLAAPRFRPPPTAWSSPDGSAAPARAYVRARQLIVENSAGVVLWRKDFDRGLQTRAYDDGTLRPTIVDLEGDGVVEILFPRQVADGVVGDVLICYSPAGDEMWRFRPGAKLANDRQTFDDVFRVGHYEPVDLGDGRRVIVLSAIHYLYEPTQIAVLDIDGTLVADYWHAGHLGHIEANLELADLNGDGKKEIYAAGINNARERATLVILDPETMGGTGRDPHGFQLHGLETDREIARVFFPRSSMNLVENQYNVAHGVFPGSGRITVGTVELYGDEAMPGIVFELDLGLTLRHIGLSDVFKATHEKLVRQRAIPPTTLEREIELLWEQGIQVLRGDRGILATGASQR